MVCGAIQNTKSACIPQLSMKKHTLENCHTFKMDVHCLKFWRIFFLSVISVVVFFTFHSVSFLQALYLYLSFNFTSLVFILQSHFTSLVFILQSHFTSLVFILQSHFYKPCVYTSVSLLQALCLYFSDLRREHEELWDIVYTSRNRMWVRQALCVSKVQVLQRS